MRSTFLFMSVALTAAMLTPPARAQGARDRPSVAEASLRRRVESWLRDRAQKGLACRMCECVADRVVFCGDCNQTGVNAKKIGAALWRYMPPSLRRVNDEESWTRGCLQGTRGQWATDPYAVSGLSVNDVIVSRDAAWAWVAPSNAAGQLVATMWIREGDGYYLAPADGAPGDTIVGNPWFVTSTYSVHGLHVRVARLEQSVAEANLTDLERERRTVHKAEEERAMYERILADVGRVKNVRREVVPANALQLPRSMFIVTVVVGVSTVNVTLAAFADADAKAREERLASLAVGSTVAVRGRIGTWVKNEGGPSLEALDLLEGEIELLE